MFKNQKHLYIFLFLSALIFSLVTEASPPLPPGPDLLKKYKERDTLPAILINDNHIEHIVILFDGESLAGPLRKRYEGHYRVSELYEQFDQLIGQNINFNGYLLRHRDLRSYTIVDMVKKRLCGEYGTAAGSPMNVSVKNTELYNNLE